ncbi:MAG: PHP-associated domain-containing protein, partial [Methanocorpusculum sp.]|nr:PHP-associated domain-containing protein [Methanocorpusculum sp.]
MCASVYHEPFPLHKEQRAFDMHLHTSASDGLSSPKTVAKFAEKKGMGIAVTDHNTVSGVKTARGFCKNVIPAMEISAREGPHLLVYFDSVRDLQEYYERSIRDCKGKCPHMAVQKTTEQIVPEALDAGGLVVAAHPYGYGVSVRGVMKGIAAGLTPEFVAKEIDGLEVICSGLSFKQNERAELYASREHLCMTGGSDAHVLWEIGHAVTAGFANETTEEFLER